MSFLLATSLSSICSMVGVLPPERAGVEAPRGGGGGGGGGGRSAHCAPPTSAYQVHSVESFSGWCGWWTQPSHMRPVQRQGASCEH